MRPFIALFILLLSLAVPAQVRLKRSIGQASPPRDSDSVSAVLVWGNNDPEAEKLKFEPGDTIPQFILYSLQGEKLDIAKELAKKRPVLLVSANYTCPRYRHYVSKLDTVVKKYGNRIGVFIIYCIESHPKFPEVCPYTGDHYALEDNYKAKINYAQPKTYGDRKKMVEVMMEHMKVPAPVFIDSPQNTWLNAFGPASNMAFLIRPNGVIYSEYQNYTKYSFDIEYDIETLLKIMEKK